MSAPPIGITIRIPKATAIMAAVKNVLVEGSMTNHADEAIMPSNKTIFITCRIGSNNGLVGTTPWSFPYAMRLPLRVAPPTMTLAMIVIETSCGINSSRSIRRINSPAATTAEVAPPKPLKIATSCGMEVIWTFLAE